MLNYNKAIITCPMCKCQFKIDKKVLLEKAFIACPSCDMKLEGNSITKLQETLKIMDELETRFNGRNSFKIELTMEQSASHKILCKRVFLADENHPKIVGFIYEA